MIDTRREQETPRSSDKRMLWIRDLDALRTEGTAATLDAEFGSEVAVAGLLDYADGAIRCSRVMVEVDAAGMYRYFLRLKLPAPQAQAPSQGTARGYIFPKGAVGELLALFSLFLEARLYLLSISHLASGPDTLPIKQEVRPLRGAFGPDLDRVVFAGTERNFATALGSFLDQIRSIPAEKHQAVAFATSHYARALRQIGLDEEMVFVRLVSAVESLAQGQPIPDDRVDGASLEQRLCLDRLSPDEREEITTSLRTRRTKARFVAFLQQFCIGFFDREPREPQRTQVTPETLGAVAKAVYDARSAYLHSGDPMYLSLRIHDRPGRHMDPFSGMTWQDRAFRRREKLPYADFFHRLIRHCLLAYIRALPPTG